MNQYQAAAVLFAVLALAYVLMLRGWRRRARRHDLAPLHEAEPIAEGAVLKTTTARYFGTTTANNWLDRVVTQGLGPRASCDLVLSAAGLDILRSPRSFRIPAAALRGVRHDQGIAGKVVPPHGVLVVTWAHGDALLETGLRLTDRTGRDLTSDHNAWLTALNGVAGSSLSSNDRKDRA